MRYFEKLLRAEASGIVALLICACLMGIYGFLESFMWSLKGSKLMITPLDAAWLVFGYTGIIGLVPVLFYGAPVYAFLSYRRVVPWWAVLLVGSVPGIGILFIERDLGVWFLVCGVVVAFIAHLLSVWFVPDKPAL